MADGPAGVRMKDGSEILADQVALCAGAWSKSLAETAGAALPLQAVEHMYVVTEPVPGLSRTFPVLRDLDRGLYMKGDVGRLLFGCFEPNAKCWDPDGPEGDRPFLEFEEDWDRFSPYVDAAMELVPRLETTSINRFLVGPESFTGDTRPLIGEMPELEGLFVAAGMNSTGVMSSAGVGSAVADWMVDGCPPFDLWEVDIARVDSRASSGVHMTERMSEAVADAFALRWPFKQPSAGRDLRQSPLHEQLRESGAVFGLGAGWERPLWFARCEAERSLPYSIGEQPWQPIADREAREMAKGCALVDLSPLTKIDIDGSDALRFMQSMVTASVNVAIGKAVYALLLNDRGGIEIDAVIVRIDEARFRATTGAATRAKDVAWFRRGAAGFDVTITDRTESEAVIGVFGPGARELLELVSADSWQASPRGTAGAAEVAGAPAFATRMSFVGEAGWELSVSAECAGDIYGELRRHGAAELGMRALEGCRMEKGFRHWGHDIGSDVTPLEAGLAFAVDWRKTGFRGKAALERQRDEGIERRLTLFEVLGSPLILHDEVILENGRGIGLTTSGAKGPRTGRTLAFGMIPVEPGESVADTTARRFSVSVAGRRCPASALRRPPYDPDGTRMSV